MPRLIVRGFAISLALPVLLLGSCGKPAPSDCSGSILDLEMRSRDEPGNKILNYQKTNAFVLVDDTASLLRYESVGRAGYLMQPSKTDSTKLRFEYSVKEAIIRTDKYQWDVIAVVDKDDPVENIQYWLKAYDQDRKKVGHLDFASWSAGEGELISGRIDCDSTLHLILNERNEHRVFSIDESGVNHLIETKKITE
jgi:hypothetical protein